MHMYKPTHFGLDLFSYNCNMGFSMKALT